MVGKWYKFIDKSGYYLTKSKWYECKEINKYYVIFLDNEKDLNNYTYFSKKNFGNSFDLSNPMDYNPDEVKEEPKPEKRCDTITIELLPDNKLTLHTTIETLRKFLALVDNEKA